MKIEDYKWRCESYQHGNKTAFISTIKVMVMDFKAGLKQRMEIRRQYKGYLQYIKEQNKSYKRLDRKAGGKK